MGLKLIGSIRSSADAERMPPNTMILTTVLSYLPFVRNSLASSLLSCSAVRLFTCFLGDSWVRVYTKALYPIKGKKGRSLHQFNLHMVRFENPLLELASRITKNSPHCQSTQKVYRCSYMDRASADGI
jgi:hypothetical protein